jgi:hypothetical protein
MPKGKEAPFKLPKTLAACADLYASLNEARLALDKQSDALKKQASQVKEHIIANLPKSDARGIAGKVVRVTIVKKVKARVADWDAFWAKFDKKKDRDLLQKRLSDEAVNARWEVGKEIAGVESFTVVDLSVNRLK